MLLFCFVSRFKIILNMSETDNEGQFRPYLSLLVILVTNENKLNSIIFRFWTHFILLLIILLKFNMNQTGTFH